MSYADIVFSKDEITQLIYQMLGKYPLK